jgi:peptide chain release factor 2
MAAQGFWDDQESAKRLISEMKALKALTEPLSKLQKTFDDAGAMFELAVEENDLQSLEEAAGMVDSAVKELERFKIQATLSAPEDSENAYLSIHSGAGGTESCDWAEMLLRMYLRWAERNGFDVELIDRNPGEEAGIKGTTIMISGPFAYGRLKSEIGVHRLVRISPYDSAKRRHTSFASADVIPETPEDEAIEINEKDIRVDTYRAGGAGGQHVNKTSSAVRITHFPSGIVVQCQNERSQHQNRRVAMKLLVARLANMQRLQREAELAKSYDAKGEIAWGNQIRSYVLQPYQMVKDHRTDYETSNVQAVLDGEINEFIEAYLKQSIGKQN